ncbi:MAG TPA: fasciclin domain-containing protein [Chitinophagaceae bacterium]|nr:fasciclin domain-containing protein [Chitinophagaceae bacterium]
MKNRFCLIGALIMSVCILYLASCKKTQLVTTTTADVNIYSYLVKDPDRFSEYVKIIDKAGYSEFLDAYGAYTAFAPDNNAVKSYLQEIGKPDADAITVDEAKSIVKLHLIQDTINTTAFKDGKLPQITMYGQYLLTGVINKDGVSSYIVNRIAIVTQPNIRLSNGLIHALDHVLKPATKTVAQLIKEKPEFSIFAQALDATGFSDSLLNVVNNPDTTKRFLTVLTETNKALQDSGITSYTDLKNKYSQTGNPRNREDSLYLYVAYHILPDAKYLADIVTSPSHQTLAPLEVVTSKLDGETVLINDLVFNGNHEQGVVIDRSTSDVTATNGVLHVALAHFAIKNRVPVRVDWDVADVPEIRKLTAVFRKSTPAPGTPGGFTLTTGSIADIKWEPTAGQPMAYAYTGLTSTVYYQWWGDFVIMPMGLTNNARAKWYEFTTPLLVRGKYKVWICYKYFRQSSNNPAFPLRVLFDGEPFSRLFRFEEQMPAGLSDGEGEALGWKRYTAEAPVTNRDNVARLVGVADVKSTDRHVIRFEALTGGGQSGNYLDMIQFIPVNDNQLRPVFARDGRIVQ